MLKLLRSLLPTDQGTRVSPLPPTPQLAAPLSIAAPGVEDFSVGQHLSRPDGLPILDWQAAHQWVDTVAGEAAQADAWLACERAWLAHMRDALGPSQLLHETADAMLVSSLDEGSGQAMLDFVAKSVRRVVALLDGIAEAAPRGKELLIVFDDEDTYYRYVSHAYAEGGHFAASSGMYINAGCGHFVTVKNDLHAIEPVVVHELTHSCVDHLPIPAWLNEGIAVNTERRLCPPPGAQPDQRRMHERHCAFWGREEIQEFWSGKSFLRPDQGNELSYDLARIIVAHYATDWTSFRAFVLAASIEDSGARAARQCLGVDLGDMVAALLEQPSSQGWAPDPASWPDAPERGAFQG